MNKLEVIAYLLTNPYIQTVENKEIREYKLTEYPTFQVKHNYDDPPNYHNFLHNAVYRILLYTARPFIREGDALVEITPDNFIHGLVNQASYITRTNFGPYPQFITLLTCIWRRLLTAGYGLLNQDRGSTPRASQLGVYALSKPSSTP